MKCAHRLWLTSCRRCRTVAYLTELVEADRSREAGRRLSRLFDNLPGRGASGGAAPESVSAALPISPTGPSVAGAASTLNVHAGPSRPLRASAAPEFPGSLPPQVPQGRGGIHFTGDRA